MKSGSIEAAWGVLQNINEWIRFSDTKAAALITADWIIIGFLAVVSKTDSWWVKGPAIISIAFSFISIFYAIASLNPRLKIGQSNSIIFFGHIAKRDASVKQPEEKVRLRKTFDKEFLETLDSEEKFITEVADQVWANSHVAWKKFKQVTISVRWFIAALIISVAFVALLMIV